MPIGVGQPAQVIQRASVGERIQIDDAQVRISAQQMADKIAANEPGTAGDQHMMGLMLHRRFALIEIKVEFGDDRNVVGRALQSARGLVDPAGGTDGGQRRAD